MSWQPDDHDIAYAFDGVCPETEEAMNANLRRFFGHRYRWVSRNRYPSMWWAGILRRPSWPRLRWNRRFPVGGVLVYVGWSVTIGWFEVWGYWLDLDATWDGKAKEMAA